MPSGTYLMLHSKVPPNHRTVVRSVLACVAALAAVAPASLSAQGQTAKVSAPVSAAVERARIQSDAGDAAKSKHILDSLVGALPRESNDVAEALYWRAMLSEDGAAAERDWKRIVVESPFSPRASGALLTLSELNVQRGNGAIARQNIQQLLADHPDAAERPRAMLLMARSYFEDRDAPRACGVLTVVRREAPISAVEVRLQADEMQQRCRNVREVAMGAEPAPAAPTTAAPVTTAPTTPARGTLATQTATLPNTNAPKPPVSRADSTSRTPATPTRTPTTPALTPMDSAALAKATRDSTTRANIARRDSIARAVVAAKLDSVKKALDEKATRDFTAKTTASAREDSIRSIALSRADSLRRVIERDSVLRDSLLKVYAARDAAAGIISPRERARRDSIARAASGEKAPAAKPARARFSIQVAAYDTRAQANALIKKLNTRNMDAHIAGTKKPFRVQVGRYTTRAEATDALAALKKKGQKGFVVEVPPS